jgi:LPXTG-motif cell wall-anchored protein
MPPEIVGKDASLVFLYFENNPLATVLGFLAFALVCVLIYIVRRRRHK